MTVLFWIIIAASVLAGAELVRAVVALVRNEVDLRRYERALARARKGDR